MQKFFSRRFLYPILFGILVGINKMLFDSALPDDILNLIAGLILAFILGETAVDAVNAWTKNMRESNKNE